jgi:hypothetical protein
MKLLGSRSAWAAIVAVAAGAVLVVPPAPAAALTYDVTQGGVSLGTITPFSSAETGAEFYSFGVPYLVSGQPLGVPLAGDRSILYVHLDTNTGVYSLGWIHGKEGEGPLRYLQGMVQITADVASPGVVVSDDPGTIRQRDEEHLGAGLDELFVDGSDPHTFYGTWRWGPRRTDGGAIAPIGTTPYVGGATATITSLDRTGEDLRWFAASADGSLIALTTEENNAATLTATPELPPLALASLAAPLGWLRWSLRRRKGK